MSIPKKCYCCGGEDTYALYTKEVDTLKLSQGRTLLMPNAQSWRCVDCGDEIFDEEQCNRIEDFIMDRYPDYYTAHDGLRRNRQARIAAVERMATDGCPVDGEPGGWLSVI